MTTREEALALMDYLRHFDTLGERCREETGGIFTHRPEACAQEVAEYLAWERMLRASGPVAGEAYFLIRRTATKWWEEHHDQPLDAGLAERAASGVWHFDQDLFYAEVADRENIHGINLQPTSVVT